MVAWFKKFFKKVEQQVQLENKGISVKINGELYHIAATWADVDVDELVKCKTKKDELAALSDIPRSIIDKYDDIQLFPLYTIISFIHEAELLPYVQDKELTVERTEYRKVESVKAILREGKPYQKIIKAARVYYPKEKNSVHLVGLGLYIVDEIVTFLTAYEEMTKAAPEKNEVEAGIEELGAFGYWGTAYVMAGRNILLVDQVLSMPAIEVYTALLYSFRENKYNKRKFELDHPPKK